MEVQASFVYDDQKYDFPAYPASQESWPGISSRAPDPFLGTWESLLPQVGRAGNIIRQAMGQGLTQNLESAAREIWTALLIMEVPESQAALDQEAMTQCSQATLPTPLHSLHMGEAHRLSTMIMLLHYFPQLEISNCRKLIFTGGGESTDALAKQGMVYLRSIPLSSSLWHVAAFPILSAGQFISEPHDREFLRGVMDMLNRKVLLPPVQIAIKLLNVCWTRLDQGNVTTWVKLMEEWGFRALMN